MTLFGKLRLIVEEAIRDRIQYLSKRLDLAIAKASLNKFTRNFSKPEFQNDGVQKNSFEIFSEYRYAVEPLKSDIADIENFLLTRTAERLGIPFIPEAFNYYELPEGWEHTNEPSVIRLDQVGRKKLYEEIMRAKEVRRAPLISWIALAISFIGIIFSIFT
ncbi:hypothetical protein [Methylobrevis albus]|uniref:Uncharacterized protein n=1 Tax=Methylobrevis albus TaxID=2793297 RepID=A0A931I4G5_9HYPH|nr:hypothetical protein [Methylobrevis albus]MBH0239118.1 hypothetical protein [Methylobrevis albus]